MLVLFHKRSDKPELRKALTPDKVGRLRPERTDSRLGDLIGASPAMHQLFDMIRLLADSVVTVLIQGESGTGKELVARTIHQTSYRRNKPFVVVDCGALSETMLESELSGHVKGAFTGAVAAKPGVLCLHWSGFTCWRPSSGSAGWCFCPSCWRRC